MRHVAVFLFLLALLALAPASASAVTLPEIVRLSKAGVSDAVLIALIERDSSTFQIDAEQLLVLKQEGVSEPVLVAMLKREPTPTPAIIIIGHDPEWPTGAHQSDNAASALPPIPVIFIPYFLPPRGAGPVAVNVDQGTCATAMPAVAPPQVDPMTTNAIGHIWTPPAPVTATPVAPCERIAPRIRVRPHR